MSLTPKTVDVIEESDKILKELKKKLEGKNVEPTPYDDDIADYFLGAAIGFLLFG